MSLINVDSTRSRHVSVGRARRLLWPIALIAALTLSACGGSASTTTPQATPCADSACVPPSSSASVAEEAPVLLALADGVQGGVGLWTLDASGEWQTLEPLADGRAVARNGNVITIAHPSSLETRSVSRPDTAASMVQLTWTGGPPDAPIVAVDRSIMGSTAIVAADEDSLVYGVATPDGTVIPLQGAPANSFAPLVSWSDADSVLLLVYDKNAVSRLAVLNVSKRASATATLLGVRAFGLSLDRQVIVAATESGVFLGQVSVWFAGGRPLQIIALDPAQVVWQLVLDEEGTHLAMLSGTVAEDGSVSNVRELGYAKMGSAWVKTFDKPVPFTHCLGQVWFG
jgi:hypothetical protein